MELASEYSVEDLLAAVEAGRLDHMQAILGAGRVDVNATGRIVDAFGDEETRTTLAYACERGRIDAVELLLSRDDIQVNSTCGENGWSALMFATDRDHMERTSTFLSVSLSLALGLVRTNWPNDLTGKRSALMIASERGHAEVVRLLMGHSGVDVNLADADGRTAIMFAIEFDHMEVVGLLSEHAGEKIKKYIDFAIRHDKYEALATILKYIENGNNMRYTNDDGKPLVECCAQYLGHKAAMKLLILDMPVEIQDGNFVQRKNHSYSWSSFMDATHPVKLNVRLSCLQSILNEQKYEPCTEQLLRELAFAKDKHDREVIQITDASTRKYFYDHLFYCGRYEIFDGPPVHVSNTAVVVMAYDHGICVQLYHKYKNGSTLDVNGFIECNKVLGREVSKFGTKKDKKREGEKWNAEFQLWDKDSNGSLSEDEFLRYCAQYCGKKLKVAMKFMKNSDEYQREIDNREGLDNSFVLSFLPSVDQSAFQANLNPLKIHGGYPMTEYPHVMVMPAADRSLEDIYLKERPGENEQRILLQQVAEGLQHLHKNELVHGDVKKLNVIRVGHRLKLIDLDAATDFRDPVGAKFSSGCLPPELFYKLESAEEIDLHSNHWANVESTNQELWQKVKPKGNFVVKSYRHKEDELPYTLVKAHPSLDVWAFGALMYKMCSGEELVATDKNQDVLDDKIEQAATWTQEHLKTRIHNKIGNCHVRDLLEKLLVVNPDDRITMSGVLEHPYFKVDPSGITDKFQEVIDKVIETNANVLQVDQKVDRVIDLSNEHLKQLSTTKQDIMRGVFQATEVIIPTSFVILPMDLTKESVGNGEEKLDSLFKFMCTKTIDFSLSVAKAMKSDSAIISTGDPMFLYLVDEVEGTPVIPSSSQTSVYPIRIDTQTPQFLAVAAPFLQAGLNLLHGIKTVTTLAKYIGISNPTNSVVDNAIKLLKATKMKSSVVNFNVVHLAVQAGSQSPKLVQRIRGAALRELELFFKEKDSKNTYAGLQRTYTADGHALWTSPENAEKINMGKPQPETLTAAQEQSNSIVKFYKELLQVHDDKKIEDNTPNKELLQVHNDMKIEVNTPNEELLRVHEDKKIEDCTPNLTRKKEDEKEIEKRSCALMELDTNPSKEGRIEKVCTCELM
ncbi:Aste57867_1023 [Aphanomyces stellatus]|uniref:Aste57867_1023 protein n=1 Tax=Aphanomyces stellatus TaxID=120398 RepID=A0A485K992_9STRA|nr:hypothetical protein As57867_001022 [Aphanomyces stellatus]VFT78245.1 Aste57867_1023 [Aphanomyces stellatus]